MSYTILTIPFNLKEKNGGDFLDKGFVIDEILSEYFEIESASNTFLHVATFDDKAIKRTAINLFIEGNFSAAVKRGERSNGLFVESAFYDKTKYLPLAHVNVGQMKPSDRNSNKSQADFEKIGIKNFEYEVDNVSVPIDDIIKDIKFLYKMKINDKETYETEFEIDKIKIFINKSQHTKDAIGFGFIEIILKWSFSNAQQMLENLGPVADFFRYYGTISKNEFEVCWNAYLKDEIQKFSEEIQEAEKNINEGRVPVEHINNQKKGLENKRVKIDQLNRLILNDEEMMSSEQLTFKLLIDNLLKPLKELVNNAEIFDFLDESHKPYILHLSSHKCEDGGVLSNSSVINFKDIDVIRKSYRLVRIPGANNIEINNEVPQRNIISPDLYSSQFILNEGAIVVEGIHSSTDLPNKYYPAFLLALNQKYLFNYLQEKINQLPLDKSGKYKIENIKKLQQTMIYAEFTQIYTSLSNYNEIDLFFENLREQFKIKELKEEYFSSINGLSKISQLNDKEEEDTKNKLENRRLQAVLFVLTIIQILPIIYDNILVIYFEFLANEEIKAIVYTSVLVLLFIVLYSYWKKPVENKK
jgi:hypothetical protein